MGWNKFQVRITQDIPPLKRLFGICLLIIHPYFVGTNVAESLLVQHIDAAAV
jgi:hypothetical protein